MSGNAQVPDQPIHVDERGARRFRENPIVRDLLETSPMDLNEIAVKSYPRWARVQLMQLIGYSVSGYSELSFVTDKEVRRAENATREVVPSPPTILDAFMAEVRQAARKLLERQALVTLQVDGDEGPICWCTLSGADCPKHDRPASTPTTARDQLLHDIHAILEDREHYNFQEAVEEVIGRAKQERRPEPGEAGAP